MGLLIFFLVAVKIDKIVEVRFVEEGPVVDGVIEEIWEVADSATNFIQVMPYEKRPPTERTVVYLLQDKYNLYVAFRAYTENHKCVVCLGGVEDNVTLYLDPYGSKNNAYYFTVNASGKVNVENDGLIVDDGRTSDETWDGVWYSGVKIYDNFYIVEIKIPFKSIRYKKDLSNWGINFNRYITKNKEIDYWTEVEEFNMEMVSKFGVLKGVNPKTTGYHFELYPEGYVRYEKKEEEEGVIKLFGSLNFKWDFTSEGTINATINPDFAQIEADPFELNLGRYPIYLEERRPFVLEGKEIFRLSDFGEERGFYSPLDIFYTRKIGKSIEGEPVPILTGIKLTNKSKDWNVGILGAYTDLLDYLEDDTLEMTEPRRGFGVLRVKRKVLENSDIGILLSGAMANREDYNYAIGVDGVYLSGMNQFILQGAMSERNGKKGWAISSGFFGFVRGFLATTTFEIVSDSFDVSDIGFVPWAGRKHLMLSFGPFKTYQEGSLRTLYFGPLIVAHQEEESPNWSKLGGFVFNLNFRNYWGFHVIATAGPYYEEDINYFSHHINLSFWGSGEKYRVNFGGNYDYEYNYNREYLAYQVRNWLSLTYTPISRISLILRGNMWIEWDTLGPIVAITPRLTPRIRLNLTKDIELNIFNEFVMETPGTDFSELELISNRFGLLFSWNFAPKSWLYIALNDFREQDDYGNLQLENQVGAIKAKYLIYF